MNKCKVSKFFFKLMEDLFLLSLNIVSVIKSLKLALLKRMDNPEVDNPLDQFTMLSVIGKGSYAKVVLVRKKSNGNLYAMKSMKKKYIEKKKQEGRILVEKTILTEINHPFLVHMNCSFQNEKKLFLVLQYCPGGELFGLLSKRKRLTEDQARFYSAQVLLALEYLHQKNIIYRDLKPENVLIDAQGYIKLTDFGLSKNNMLGDRDAMSVCGTPEYLAPEVIKKQGHGKAVDYWCLGSLIYELIHGLPPFYSKNRGQLFDKIKHENPYFSINWSKNIRNLMTMLFEKDPQVRLANIANIKSHPWYSSINWEKLSRKELPAPFIPKIENELDTQNFDRQFTECDIQSQMGSLDECKKLQGFSFERSPKVQHEMIPESEEMRIQIEIQ